MRWMAWAIVAMVVSWIGTPIGMAQTRTFPTLYDDFHGAQIDPARWAGSGAFGYEMSRGLDQTVGAGRLVMAVQAYGYIGSPGPQVFGLGRNNLDMQPASAAAVRGIQVTTRIESANVTGCAAAVPGRVLAGPYGTFFRDGPNPPNPNDWTGIVEAGINVFVRADQVDQTVAHVLYWADRCLDFNCDTEFDFTGGLFADVVVGQDTTVGIELVPDPNPANTQIVFTKDNEPPQVIKNVATNQTNTDLGILHIKRARERAHLETCPTPAQGFITASFENFMTTP